MALWGKHDTQADKPKYVARIAYFNSATTVNTSAETIDLTAANTDFASGDGVVYSINGGTVIGGLTDGKTYYVGLTGTSGVISLYDTQAHAIAGGSTGKVNLTGVGVGVQTLQRTAEANVNDHNYNGRALYFEDVNEAQAPENRARGLKTPGWGEYVTYTAADGSVRNKSEILIAMGSAETQAVSGDANPAKGASGATGTYDDSVLVDATITITANPVNATANSGNSHTVTFAVGASITGPGTLAYAWQVKGTSPSDVWVPVTASVPGGSTCSNYNTATLTVVCNNSGPNNQTFRCVVSDSTTGATAKTSNYATLTYVA
jgi:hypothetical protein